MDIHIEASEPDIEVDKDNQDVDPGAECVDPGAERSNPGSERDFVPMEAGLSTQRPLQRTRPVHLSLNDLQHLVRRRN